MIMVSQSAAAHLLPAVQTHTVVVPRSADDEATAQRLAETFPDEEWRLQAWERRQGRYSMGPPAPAAGVASAGSELHRVLTAFAELPALTLDPALLMDSAAAHRIKGELGLLLCAAEAPPGDVDSGALPAAKRERSASPPPPAASAANDARGSVKQQEEWAVWPVKCEPAAAAPAAFSTPAAGNTADARGPSSAPSLAAVASLQTSGQRLSSSAARFRSLSDVCLSASQASQATAATATASTPATAASPSAASRERDSGNDSDDDVLLVAVHAAPRKRAKHAPASAAPALQTPPAKRLCIEDLTESPEPSTPPVHAPAAIKPDPGQTREALAQIAPPSAAPRAHQQLSANCYGECPVCFERVRPNSNAVSLGCNAHGHIICYPCLTQFYSKTHCACPICRAPVQLAALRRLTRPPALGPNAAAVKDKAAKDTAFTFTSKIAHAAGLVEESAGKTLLFISNPQCAAATETLMTARGIGNVLLSAKVTMEVKLQRIESFLDDDAIRCACSVGGRAYLSAVLC